MSEIDEVREAAERQRAIEALLEEDGRAEPRFATARKAGILAWLEQLLPTSPIREPGAVRWGLRFCRIYEELRGGGREPSAAATRFAAKYPETLRAYERARALT